MNATSNHLIYSYLDLRKAVGLIGMLVPFVLAAGVSVTSGSFGIERSISYYYHTAMGDVFVGAVCAIGLFLFFYRGYQTLDNVIANIAGLAAVGLAWFPTDGPDDFPASNTLHLIFAIIFFLSLAFFSLFLFTKSDPDRPKTAQKKRRNIVYIVCGSIMLLCLLLIIVGILAGITDRTTLVFWAETAALIAFGVSWLVKGEAFLADRP